MLSPRHSSVEKKLLKQHATLNGNTTIASRLNNLEKAQKERELGGKRKKKLTQALVLSCIFGLLSITKTLSQEWLGC